MAQVWDWLVAVGGGDNGLFSVLKALVGLVVYFGGLGLLWM